MASSAVIFFAGVTTVVAALGVGFGGAVMLTRTEPLQKEPAAAFAKREAPEPAAQPSAQPVAQPDESLIPKQAMTAEEIAALNYAPPRALLTPQTESSGVAAVASEPTTTGSAPSSAKDQSKAVRNEPAKLEYKPEKNTTAALPASGMGAPASDQNDKANSRKSEKKTGHKASTAEKQSPARRHYVERRKRGPEEDSEDGEQVTYVDREPGRGAGFLGFLFGQ